MNSRNIVAGIVTYDPNIDILKENITCLSKQCDEIFIVDNASYNINELIAVTQNMPCVKIYKNRENGGIAKALNQLIEIAFVHHAEWILTMDQDSLILPGVIEKYISYSQLPDVGMISCNILEKNIGTSIEEKIKENYEVVSKCITSGCFTKIKAVQEVGGFDESYFIDYVDFDMCIRMIHGGWKIIKINYAGLLHSTGDVKVLKIAGKPIKIGKNLICIYHENPLRTYYFFKNTAFFWRKYGLSGRAYTNPAHILWRAFLVVLFEHPKCMKIKMIFKGIADGRKKEIK